MYRFIYILSLSSRLCLLLAAIKEDINSELKSLDLIRIADDLPSLLQKARAEGTNKNYETAFKRWLKWSEKFPEIDAFPAKDTYVALFLTSLIQSGTLYPSIKSAFYAIKYYHKLAALTDPTDSEFCKKILDAAQRMSRRPKVKKEPLTSQNLKDLLSHIGGYDAPLPDFRNFTMMLLCFAGFLRFSEASNLKSNQVEFTETYLKLFISQSKTDIYRDGHYCYIARTSTDTCPVKCLEYYMERCRLSFATEEFIFRPATYYKSKVSYSLRRANRPISYSAARDRILKLLGQIGLNIKDFGLHSLRSGGASAAANHGVKDRLFKRHGRWKSESVKDGYIKDDLKELLSVTSNLGL